MSPAPAYGLIFYNFPGHSLEEFAAFAASAGFSHAEIAVAHVWNEKDPQAPPPEARAAEVRALLERYGLRLSALSAGNDFLQPDDRALRQQVERLETVCRLARLCGTDTVRIDGGWPKPSVPDDRERHFELIVTALRAIRPFIEREGFTLALDNHGLVTNDADFQVRIFEAVGSPCLGANVDTMNYRWAGHDLATVARFYRVIAPYARHVHFKDGTGTRGSYRGTALGEGEIPLETALDELRAAGYRGVWTVEYEGPREQAEEGYRKGLAWLKARLAPQGVAR
jgi:sugar phosphate isomerase/epimerase